MGFIDEDGWVLAGEAWEFLTADGPTFTFETEGNNWTKYLGAKIRLKQADSVKYFIVTAVSYDENADMTIVTVFGGTDYVLEDAEITEPFYSRVKAPLGFPLNPSKWTVVFESVANSIQQPVSSGVWYNMGSAGITAPIGVWLAAYSVTLEGYALADDSRINTRVSLSTSPSTESDNDLTGTFRMFVPPPAGNASQGGGTVNKKKVLAIETKTPYYLIAKSNVNSSVLSFRGDLARTRIELVCAYL